MSLPPNRNEPDKPDDRAPEPLQYDHVPPVPYQPKTPFGFQVLAGFAAWFIGIILFVQASRAAMRARREFGWNYLTGHEWWIALWLALIFLGGMTVWLRTRYRWKGFAAGLLLGVGMSILVPIALLAVFCFN
jgi:hypothetical protein